MGKFCEWYLYFAAVFGAVVLAVNRFTALCFPLRYETVHGYSG